MELLLWTQHALPLRQEQGSWEGQATYASLSSSIFAPTSLVAIVGSDFPSKYRNILDNRVDTKGIITKQDGKTFHYDSSFDYDFAHRISNKTELNVIADFEPVIPDEYIESEYIYLANNDPVQNMKILEYFSNPKLTVCDTIEYWILNKREDIVKMTE